MFVVKRFRNTSELENKLSNADKLREDAEVRVSRGGRRRKSKGAYREHRLEDGVVAVLLSIGCLKYPDWLMSDWHPWYDYRPSCYRAGDIVCRL